MIIIDKKYRKLFMLEPRNWFKNLTYHYTILQRIKNSENFAFFL